MHPSRLSIVCVKYQAIRTCGGVRQDQLRSFLTLKLHEGVGQLHALAALPPEIVWM